MKRFLTHLFTGSDNATFDIARVAWALGTMSYLGMALWNVAGLHNVPDLMTFANGFGVVLAAGGVAVGVKAHAEPKP